MTRLTRFEALELAVTKAGSQSQFARDLGIHQPTVWRWLRQSKQLPAEYVLTVEGLYGVSKHDLRPDIYPVEHALPDRWIGVDQRASQVAFNRRPTSKRRASA